MKITNDYNSKIQAALEALGIKYTKYEDVILIDRTSMVRACEKDEDTSYWCVLVLLKDLCGEGTYVTWGGRTDDWLGLEVNRMDKSTKSFIPD